jgi:hypothetical protein
VTVLTIIRSSRCLILLTRVAGRTPHSKKANRCVDTRPVDRCVNRGLGWRWTQGPSSVPIRFPPPFDLPDRGESREAPANG